MSATSVLQVVILRDGLLVGTEVFVPGTYTVGSSESADLHLDDAAIEPEHAVLYFQNDKAAIQDNGSRGGISVNGHPIKACQLRPADELACGPFLLKVRVVTQKAKPRQVPDPSVAAALRESAASPPPLNGGALPTRPAVPSPKSATLSPATMVSARRSAAAAPVREKLSAPRQAPLLRSVTPMVDTDLEKTLNVVVDPALRESHARTLPAVKRPLSPTHAAAQRPPRAEIGAPAAPEPEERRGRPGLFLELYWGGVRRESRCFGRLPTKKPLLAAQHDAAAFPLWGFQLPEEPFVLAESDAANYRLFVPRGAVVERRDARQRFVRVDPAQLEAVGGRRYLILANGGAARLSQGQMALLAYVQPRLKRPFANPFKGLPWLVLLMLAVFGGGFVAFLNFAPKPRELADFQQRTLAPAAVRLVMPEPKKPEAPKPVEELTPVEEAVPEEKPVAEKPTKKPQPVVTKVPKKSHEKPVAQAAPPENKALKALAKLSAAGPASGDILAAVDKLGNGPGSKNVKPSNFKLSGLIGKAPIANAGLGTFGLGGGGAGGTGALGAELLRGKGGGGIGALGAGGVGRGEVGGTVGRAVARNVGVKGSIDREAVARVVNSHLQEVRACYERALLHEPGLAGKVVLEWSLSTVGKVVTAKTKTSTLRSSAVEACILNNLKTWTFPPAKGGVVIVSYPFLFNSVGY